jgi:selenide,water dikinase
VVGGGAAGVEMLLAMRHALELVPGPGRVEWHLFTDAGELLPAHAPAVRARFAALLARRGVIVHRATPVAAVDSGGVQAAAGARLAVDATIWATGAAAPEWLRGTGLALDAAGFVAVDATLQSTSHAGVFAAGDVASMVGTPRPKSGVYAVRQGPPLARNLVAAASGAPLASYAPQADALALITTGERCAVATRGALTVEGRWVWRWKDWIDRRFMARYRL